MFAQRIGSGLRGRGFGLGCGRLAGRRRHGSVRTWRGRGGLFAKLIDHCHRLGLRQSEDVVGLILLRGCLVVW